MDKEGAQAQLIVLDLRLGKGQGAKKERAALQAIIDGDKRSIRDKARQRRKAHQ